MSDNIEDFYPHERTVEICCPYCAEPQKAKVVDFNDGNPKQYFHVCNNCGGIVDDSNWHEPRGRRLEKEDAIRIHERLSTIWQAVHIFERDVFPKLKNIRKDPNEQRIYENLLKATMALGSAKNGAALILFDMEVGNGRSD